PDVDDDEVPFLHLEGACDRRLGEGVREDDLVVGASDDPAADARARAAKAADVAGGYGPLLLHRRSSPWRKMLATCPAVACRTPGCAGPRAQVRARPSRAPKMARAASRGAMSSRKEPSACPPRMTSAMVSR